ncbi:DUF6285 domain-containing protein [Henriciella sp. AS95]|uniref:DUF6285 domain-containing protein n=1 Tax=Henriciella sp. AS95 TaxID=3135782 RepID=UPI0031724695
MYDQPTIKELVEAVKNFVDHTAMPELSGRAAFHARVASNVLATIARDLEARKQNDAEERSSLQALLGTSNENDLRALNCELSERLRNRTLDSSSTELMLHLKKTAIAQLKVDQPSYSGLKEAMKEE